MADVADVSTAPDDRGQLVVHPRVVERIATIAAGEVSGVVPSSTRLSRVTGGGLPKADVRLAGDRVRVSVSVAASWPVALGALATSVRDHVAEQVTGLAAMTVDGVSVQIADVVYAPERRSIR